MTRRRALAGVLAVLSVVVALVAVSTYSRDLTPTLFGTARGVGTPAQQAERLVARMTLDEKISQTYTTERRMVVGIARLGIPDFRITNGPVGVGPGSSDPQPRATALPAAISLAASFDPALARTYGVVQGRETRAGAQSLIEAPDINIARVARNGRTFEGYGEDPYLTGQLAAANIAGIQSQGVLAEVKHFAANNQEADRHAVNELIDDRTLHEIYLPAFESAVIRGGAAAVMCAYPSVNGDFMCQNRHLLRDVLRGQWGFTGFVQSDSGANHAVVRSVAAGLDLELSSGRAVYAAGLKRAVLAGRVTMAALDELIVRRLASEIRAGLFDRALDSSPIQAQADGATARAVAEQGAVLLRNRHQQLPLSATRVHSIALIGPYAGAAATGGGGSSRVLPLYTVSPRQGLRSRAPTAKIRYNDGHSLKAAVALAKRSAVAIVMVGDVETEGRDRPSLALPGNQDALVAAVAAANPHTIVVIKSGGPVLMPWAHDVPAILEAWYPGQEDGNAVADLLFGVTNPSGKLPITFPAAVSQVPTSTEQQYPGIEHTAVYSEGLQVGYRWYDAQHVAPLYPFGYGLSYTSFAFSALQVARHADRAGNVRLTVDVTNTGSRAGAEVAQVYVNFPASAGEPPQQLKGFTKVQLRPGQRATLLFNLDARAFSTWDAARQGWRAVPGTHQISVGDSSGRLTVASPVVIRG